MVPGLELHLIILSTTGWIYVRADSAHSLPHPKSNVTPSPGVLIYLTHKLDTQNKHNQAQEEWKNTRKGHLVQSWEMFRKAAVHIHSCISIFVRTFLEIEHYPAPFHNHPNCKTLRPLEYSLKCPRFASRMSF